jgi:hypothetical protein
MPTIQRGKKRGEERVHKQSDSTHATPSGVPTREMTDAEVEELVQQYQEFLEWERAVEQKTQKRETIAFIIRSALLAGRTSSLSPFASIWPASEEKTFPRSLPRFRAVGVSALSSRKSSSLKLFLQLGTLLSLPTRLARSSIAFSL